MTISTTDLKIYQAQRNRDTADGGGAMSPNEVIDGELNNLFDDISSEDRVGGRVSLRKGFAGVFSDNTDKFFGAGIVITTVAEDEGVDVLMTRSTAYDDERSDIVDRIQSFLIPGATTQWRLFNDQLQGSGALTLFGPVGTDAFDLGETLFLEDSSGQQPREGVRVLNIVSQSTQTFFDTNGSFQRDILIIQLTRPLQADWSGTGVGRSTTGTPPTRIKTATVSAGASYYGNREVTEDIGEGDTTIKTPNPFRRLVPSTTAETPLTDERASLSAVSFAQVGEDDAIDVSTGTVSFSAGETKSVFCGGTVLPGSIQITGTFAGEDQGDGTITVAGSGTTVLADYETGEIQITRNTSGNVSLNIIATPAAAVQDSTLTVQIPVTPQTRALNYIRTLRPLPAPGTIAVDYRALGNWFRLRDNGKGSLAGAQPGEGAGQVNYATGTVTATLAALPDVGTTIIFSWGTGVTVRDQTGDTNIQQPRIRIALAGRPIVPGTLEITYPSGSSAVDLVDDGEGNITLDGDSTVIGSIVYETGIVQFRPTAWPTGNIVSNWDQGVAENDTFTPSVSSDEVTFSLPETTVIAGSVRLRMPVAVSTFGTGYTATVEAVDDGQGGFRYAQGNNLNLSGAIAGATINYSTGAVVFPASIDFVTQVPQWISTGIDLTSGAVSLPTLDSYDTITTTLSFSTGGTIQAQYQAGTPGDTPRDQTNTTRPLRVQLRPLLAEGIVPGSVRFTLNGRTYVDRQGDLIHTPGAQTNAGTLAGTIDYQSGEVIIDDPGQGDYVLSLVGCGLLSGSSPTAILFFRTPAAPISPASLTIQATALDDGSLIQATADQNGVIDEEWVQGIVDQENGIVELTFGKVVVASGNESEWWYDANAVDGDGNIYQPRPILPGSAFFSAVALQSIPLDPQILGLDPILLPSDGRVPVFRSGDSLMIVQRGEAEESSPTAGGITELPISNVQWVRVRDANDNDVLSEHYELLKEDGEIQWANPLDLAAYTGPFTIEAMSYFKRLCTDVQINGTVTMSSPAPFDMNLSDGPIFLCSKLILLPDGGNQDLQALALNLFTQEAWTGTWSNQRQGSGTNGAYDDVNFPIIMQNNGSITERWRLQFTGSQTVNVIGERFGQILTGASILTDISPINPATGTPYFTLSAAGFSGGWQTGNVIRFNTLGANDPVWFIRSTQPGDAPDLPSDRVITFLQGDTRQT